MVTHMDEPCDICGDIGVSDAIITCCDCKIAREHAYCMKTPRPDIPLFWRCKECKPGNELLSPKSGAKEDLPKAPMRNYSGIVRQYVNPGGFNKLSSHLRRSHFREKGVDKGKTKYIPCQEAIKLSSGSRKLEPPLKRTLVNGPPPSKRMPTKCERPPIGPKPILPKINSKAKADPTIEGLGKSKPRSPGDLQINPVIQPAVAHSSSELKDSKAIRHLRERIAQIRQPSDTVKYPEEMVDTEMGKVSPLSVHCPDVSPVTSGSNACNDVEMGSSNAQNLNHIINASEVEKDSRSIPSLHAYWKGSFKLPNSLGNLELNDGIKAHPPTRVHIKVYEVLKKMPGVLEFELVPRFKVWADTFADYCPDEDDIGLYFFPCNSDSSEKYNSLLEFIWKEKLVMRTSVDGVELLVLTSRVLDLDSQNWKGDQFLWGVFRHVKIDKAAADNNEVHPSDNAHESHSEGEESVVEDMEIDMIGGHFVGRIDTAVKDSGRGSSGMGTAAACISEGSVRKDYVTSRSCDNIVAQPLFAPKQEPCNDIPPGFERVRSGMESAAARILEISVRKAHVTSTNCNSIAAQPLLALKQEPCNDISPGFERVFSKEVVSALSLGNDYNRLLHVPGKAKTEVP